jgi:hypothetical protein
MVETTDISNVLSYIAAYKQYSSMVGRNPEDINYQPIRTHFKLRFLAFEQEYNKLRADAINQLLATFHNENPDFNIDEVETDFKRELKSLAFLKSGYDDLIQALKEQYEGVEDRDLFFSSAVTLAQSDCYKTVCKALNINIIQPGYQESQLLFTFPNYNSFRGTIPERYVMIEQTQTEPVPMAHITIDMHTIGDADTVSNTETESTDQDSTNEAEASAYLESGPNSPASSDSGYESGDPYSDEENDSGYDSDKENVTPDAALNDN